MKYNLSGYINIKEDINLHLSLIDVDNIAFVIGTKNIYMFSRTNENVENHELAKIIISKYDVEDKIKKRILFKFDENIVKTIVDFVNSNKCQVKYNYRKIMNHLFGELFENSYNDNISDCMMKLFENKQLITKFENNDIICTSIDFSEDNNLDIDIYNNDADNLTISLTSWGKPFCDKNDIFNQISELENYCGLYGELSQHHKIDDRKFDPYEGKLYLIKSNNFDKINMTELFKIVLNISKTLEKPLDMSYRINLITNQFNGF